MNSMFWDADAFNQPLGDWRVDEVTDMGFMFYDAWVFNQPLGDWGVAAVTDMLWMFSYAPSFNQDIGDWAIDSVTSMEYMFESAEAFDQDLGWCVADGVSLSDAFSYSGCESTSCGVTQGNCPMNSRRDRRLTFDSDSGSPPWHRLWELSLIHI